MGQIPRELSMASTREIHAQKLKRVLGSVGARQIVKPTEIFRLRHLVGLSFCRASAVPANIPVSLIKGSLRVINQWWRDDLVRRYFRDEELTADRRVGETDKYLIRTETRDIVLLDGEKIKTIRKIYYDKKKGLHSKVLLAQDESGKVFEYNAIPKNLTPLEGLECVSISPDKDILVVEGYPAAESLRKRGIEAVGIISGTFNTPSERTLEPLLKAKNIILWPDNDSAGVTLMSRVAKALHTMGAREGRIKLVFWREGPRKGDAYDFTGDEKEFQNLFDKAVVWSPEVYFATSNIQYLSVWRTSPRLRLDQSIQPPTPELVREKIGFHSESVLTEIIHNLVDTKPISDGEKDLLEPLVSEYLKNRR